MSKKEYNPDTVIAEFNKLPLEEIPTKIEEVRVAMKKKIDDAIKETQESKDQLLKLAEKVKAGD